ncbi:short-chain dehydrogenase reductase sdr [Colletotrichum truncatum]|uniref:Short-chain dehydrogenase reductase sdr n=1 Tax=Colletotrichum truncatum TaxID=5467 RepID=A0ACC3ZFS3_COLTU|nr:short-chain dehydrogenase reductase sdr [Colletotrichum truncatum]KAF6801839.1 short-chain dehydrogenase reductase sdr [Colletotrichum truncatum]
MKVWFVTGSSRGLGLELVKTILANGDSVIATARDPQQLNHLVEKYGSNRILPVALDVTNSENACEVVKLAQDTFGRIDVVVNNAGYAETAPIEDMTLESFRAQMETNFFGVVNVTKAVLPILRQQGSGHILQVSSVGGRVGSPGLGAYQSAKWAVGGFSTVLSREVAPFGVKITVLEPGGMKTDWAGSSMGHGHISEAYVPIVGAMEKAREQAFSNWSEPSRVAETIFYITTVEDPPLRLLLGPDTVQYAEAAARELAASDEKWKQATNLLLPDKKTH